MHFEHIIGNDNVKSLLTHTIHTNNILHSYMFIGLDGIGKSLFAKDFANMILCTSTDFTNKPCGLCEACTLYASSNHPDFMLIEPEDGKSVKIEQIRYLQEKIAEKPITSSKKVYVINDSDTMTKEAQNCLLKTLEEPPEYAVIILVLSNESQMLPTIKSRCTKIVFHALKQDELNAYFSLHYGNTLDDNILKVCNGSIKKAIETQDDMELYTQMNTILHSLEQNDMIDVWNNSDSLYQAKDKIQSVLEYISIVLMNQLLYSQDMRYANCIQIIEQTKKRLTSNANFDMCIDNLLLKMWEEFHEKYSWH